MNIIRDQKLFWFIALLILGALGTLMVYGNFLTNDYSYFIKNIITNNLIPFIGVSLWMIAAIIGMFLKQKTGRMLLAVTSGVVFILLLI